MSKIEVILKRIKRLIRKGLEYEYFYRFSKTGYKYEKEYLKTMSQNCNIPYRKLKWDYILSTYRYGDIFLDYSLLGLYKYSNMYRKKFCYAKKYNQLSYDIYNADATKEETDSFENKNMFNKKFKKYVNRKFLICENSEEVSKFIDNVDKFIMKPTSLSGGKGIKIVKKEEIKNKEKLIKKLITEKYLVEECLTQCKELEELNPTTINTVRPFVVRTSNDDIKMVSCVLRVGRLGADVDNASAGGIAYPVDINTGRIIGQGVDRFGNTYTYHPDTNKFMPGFQIPRWNEIVNVVTEAMQVIKTIKMVGFDVCLKEDGIELIEGNIHPSPATFQIDGPKLEIVEKYLGGVSIKK